MNLTICPKCNQKFIDQLNSNYLCDGCASIEWICSRCDQLVSGYLLSKNDICYDCEIDEKENNGQRCFNCNKFSSTDLCWDCNREEQNFQEQLIYKTVTEDIIKETGKSLAYYNRQFELKKARPNLNTPYTGNKRNKIVLEFRPSDNLNNLLHVAIDLSNKSNNFIRKFNKRFSRYKYQICDVIITGDKISMRIYQSIREPVSHYLIKNNIEHIISPLGQVPTEVKGFFDIFIFFPKTSVPSRTSS